MLALSPKSRGLRSSSLLNVQPFSSPLAGLITERYLTKSQTPPATPGWQAPGVPSSPPNILTFDFAQTNGTSLLTLDARWAGAGATTITTLNGYASQNSAFTQNTAWFAASQGNTQKVEAGIKANAGSSGEVYSLLLQVNGSQTGYEFAPRVAGDGVDFYRNGTFVVRLTGTYLPLSSNDIVMRAEFYYPSGVIAVFVNNVLVGTYTDASPLSGGYPGMSLYNGGTIGNSSLDYWTDLTTLGAGTKDIAFTVGESITASASIVRSRVAASTIAEAEAITQQVVRNRQAALSSASTQTLTASVGRFRAATLTLAEAFSYTPSLRASKTLALQIDEVETHSFASLRRVRNVAAALNEVITYAIDLTKTGPGGTAKTIEFAVAQTQAISAAIGVVRGVTTAISHLEAITGTPSRRRDVSTTLAELEALTANLRRLRAISTSVVETVSVSISIARLREQAVVIAQTVGIEAAFGRIRSVLQTIANTTDITFTLTTYHLASSPTVLVDVAWQEWVKVGDGVVLQNKVMSLIARNDFSADVLMAVEEQLTLIVEGDASVSIIVPQEMSASVIVQS